MKTLIISNEEMRNIINIVTFLEEPDLLITGVIKQLKKKKKQRGGVFCMLLGTLGSNMLWNMLASKELIRPGERIIRAGLDF